MKNFHSLIMYFLVVATMVEANTTKPQFLSKFFIKNIQNELGYFRIDCNPIYTNISQTNNNSIFTVRVSSRRNNYEEVIIMSLGAIGRYLNKQLNHAIKQETPTYSPSIVTIECETPVGRDKVIISCSLNSNILIQFGDGTITAKDLWITIKSSILASMDFTMQDTSPDIFIADIDFENMVSTRIALEGKNNPRLAAVISTALKASWVPGLESQLENMLVSHLKENHTELMQKVMGHKLNDNQMLRIGKQFFVHIQKPFDQIKQSHTRDSMKYVWKGNLYPKDLDQYYTKYRIKHNL